MSTLRLHSLNSTRCDIESVEASPYRMVLWVVYATLSAVVFTYIIAWIVKPLIRVTVNCWFCNENSRVAFNERHAFTCPKCGQYNGFAADGGYDRDIPEQRNEYLNTGPELKKAPSSILGGQLNLPSIIAHNGLCHSCNAQQNLVQAQINKFEPRNEKNFFNELKQYKDRLYKAYPLCSVCEKYTQMKVQLDKEKLGIPDRLLPTRKAYSMYSALSSFTPSRAPSQLSYATARSAVQQSSTPPKATARNRRRHRYAYLNSGPVANMLNTVTFTASVSLFLAYLAQLQDDAQVELFDWSAYVPQCVISWLVPTTLLYSTHISITALVAHLLSLNVSRARRSLPDLVACILWSVLVYLKWREPSSDVVLCELGTASILTVTAFAVAFLPRKLLHRKRPNYVISSAFSVASTPLSQCSTASTRSSPIGNLSMLNRSIDRQSNKWSLMQHRSVDQSAMMDSSAMDCTMDDTDMEYTPAKAQLTRETTPSRELGNMLNGLSLGEEDSKQARWGSATATTPSLRHRGPFNSMKRPVLTPSRLRYVDQPQYAATNVFSSRYVPSNPPSIMTSVSHQPSQTHGSFTLINCCFALLAVISVLVNMFMFYRVAYIKQD